MANRAIWQEEGVGKRTAVRGMFAEIAPTYDRLNSIMSMRLHHRWRQAAVKKLRLNAGDTALDVCCGTGDFMSPLRTAVGSTGHVFGLDFCLPMLEIAGKKLDATQSVLSLGDACQLPIQDQAVDGVSVGWGIRNVPNIDDAHRELFRVLKPGGRFVSLDMALPRNSFLKRVSQFISNKMLPKLGAMFGKSDAYTYLPKSTQTFMSREELAESMRRAGFVDVGHQDLFFGNICIHWGQRP